MPNTMIFTWVKNVNNQRMNSRIRSGSSSTDGVLFMNQFGVLVVEPRVIRQNVLYLTPTISTRIFTKLHLLINSYTHNPQSLLLEPKKKTKER
jgi:hypothetical protein